MKTASFIFIFLVQSLLCFSQNLVQEEKLWSNTVRGTEDIHALQSYWITFQEDTLINNLEYKKILQADDSLHSDWYAKGFIREDVITQKVYLTNNYNQEEILLYDFSLEAGDSILTGDGETYAKIDTVVYATFGNSTDKLKQICFDSACNLKWVEGIGSTWGVLEGLNAFYTTGAKLNLVCYYESDNLVYHNSEFNTCFPDSTTVSTSMIDNKKNIKIFPNPAIDYINISAINSMIRNVELMDMAGNCFFQNCVIDNQLFTLSTSGFPPGIYLIKVETDKQQVVRKIRIN